MHFIPDISLWGWGDLWLKVWKKYEKYIVLVRIKGHRLVHFIKQLLLNYNFFHMTLLFNKKKSIFLKQNEVLEPRAAPWCHRGPRLLPAPAHSSPSVASSQSPADRTRTLAAPPAPVPGGQRGGDNRPDGRTSRIHASSGLSYFILFYFNGSEFQKLLFYCHPQTDFLLWPI